MIRVPLSTILDYDEGKESEKVSEFVEALRERGYVVLTDLGEEEKRVSDLLVEFANFIAMDEEEKFKATSRRVYRNERGVPMWYSGYEKEQMREAFRVCAGMTDIGCWPSTQFEHKWMDLTRFLQLVCDQCLSIVLGRSVARPADPADDKSVAYAVFYPNDRGGQQEEGINIKQHVDPSLIVVEPVAEVRGLQVFDQLDEKWQDVEGNCAAGKELVVFVGKALETNTEGKFRATLHRVAQGEEARKVFIFEQKYADFYPPPVFDD